MELKLFCNTTNDYATITKSNIIGRNELRNFFCSNGWPMASFEIDYIMTELAVGKELTFTFPNKTKQIIVRREN